VADCIVKAAARLRTDAQAQVHSCYEAGFGLGLASRITLGGDRDDLRAERLEAEWTKMNAAR